MLHSGRLGNLFFFYSHAFCFYSTLRCNFDLQTECAAQFLNVMRKYMESLCSNLRSHTITSVQSNNDRVSESTFCFAFRIECPITNQSLTWLITMKLSSLCLRFQVSLLLKDSFIDSFSSKDRPFVKVSLIS